MTAHRRAVDRQCYSVSSYYCEQTTCIYSNNLLNLLLLTEIDVTARESDWWRCKARSHFAAGCTTDSTTGWLDEYSYNEQINK